MYVRYDSLNRHEPLVMTLCNPGSIYSDTNHAPTKSIGILMDTSDEELCLNFNQLSELNFRVSRVHREDMCDDTHAYNLYKSIQARRLIYVTGIGYFVISDANEGYDTSGAHYKDIKAKSVESEIQNKKVPYIADGTYRFLGDEEKNQGLFELLISTLPLWRIGVVDETVASKHRTFTDVDTDSNILSFMLEKMQAAYECLFIFDTTHRTINVFDRNNYIHKTDIHITKQDLIRSLDITENSDNVYTALSVRGGEDVTIGAVNPIGTNVIYNFDNYLGWMSEELRNKVKAWQDEIESQSQSYYELNLQYYNKMQEWSNYTLELQKIDTQIKMYKRCRENIVAESNTSPVNIYNDTIVENGGIPITIHDELEETIAEIDRLIAACEEESNRNQSLLDAANEVINTLSSHIDTIKDGLSFENYFTPLEYEELCNYVFEGSYIDEYVVITDVMSYTERFEQIKTMYDRAKIALNKASRPSQEFSIDVENFLFVKEFAKWGEQLETGCIINVEIEQDDIAQLFLSNIIVNYDDKTLKMTFGNRLNKFDTKSLFDNMLGKISKSANTLNYIKDILHPIKQGELNHMRDALNASRNLTMSEGLSSNNEEVVIDGSGYSGKKKLSNGTYDPRQVKITGRSIVFTDDAWESCKVAIGELLLGNGDSMYGVNAQAIIGDIIMGNSLRILNKDGKDLLSVVDGKIEAQIGDVNSELTSMKMDANGLNIRIQSLEEADTEVKEVTTTTGYKFDADGLHIHKSGEEMTNVLDNTGMRVTRSNEDILTANNNGVNAINLTARKYLVIGENSRFENYSNGTDFRRTACFYIGAREEGET